MEERKIRDREKVKDSKKKRTLIRNKSDEIETY